MATLILENFSIIRELMTLKCVVKKGGKYVTKNQKSDVHFYGDDSVLISRNVVLRVTALLHGVHPEAVAL